MNYNQISQSISVFHQHKAPEEGTVVGYAALVVALGLPMPLPQQICLISLKNRQYQTQNWQVFTPRHAPDDTLYKHLVFALKYEGVNLLCFKKIFEKLSEQAVIELLSIEPQGQYSRKIWFLYEWLLQKKLPLPDLKQGNYVTLINVNQQFALAHGVKSQRHRIENNLPGNVDFCPLIFKTPQLLAFIEKDLSLQSKNYNQSFQKDILLRASAFLLLKDTKASFYIEGENPIESRAMNWGKAIGEAGRNLLSATELERLQRIVIENNRFLAYGFRKQQGFIGEHDRDTFEPLPEHISAKHQDLSLLMQGLFKANDLLELHKFHAVLSATCIAFGFVFIHPFVDGNGRLHRYLIHHVLSKHEFTPQGIVFPISAAILAKINQYRQVLVHYSQSILPFIDWTTSLEKNVVIHNETIDYYRYFDATAQAEFLFECIENTIFEIIPQEINYLLQYDAFKSSLKSHFQMPDKIIAQLHNFLQQNDGKIAKKRRSNDFKNLTDEEIILIESIYYANQM